MNLFPAIAAKLQQNPACLREALCTVDRWISDGRQPTARLITWRELITRAIESPEDFNQLLNLLRDESEEARRLKDFAPFAGILTREERRDVFLTCSYDH